MATCIDSQIDVAGDGTNCVDTKFNLTTTNLSANSSFNFSMSAVGTFYVDCGNSGTLKQGSTTLSNNTITRTDTTITTYTCTYSSAGIKNIKLAGIATDYHTNYETAAIKFYVSSSNATGEANAAKIASVSGNLSTMFPYISENAADAAQPRFFQTFCSATNLTSIPDTLFANYTTAARNMFRYTFRRCTGLTSIPEKLFNSFTTPAYGMFTYTFSGCTSLTSIPKNLFSSFTTARSYIFSRTFELCTGLTSIPEDLFATIPTGAQFMFESTFYGCTGLRSIPKGLFSHLTKGNYGMFWLTFNGCTGLTSIPEDLFATIATADYSMFNGTFKDCRNISGYIPPSTFAGLIAHGSQTIDMWKETFYNTKLVTTCPAGTSEYQTGFKGTNSSPYTKWGDYVSCIEDAPHTCSAGQYLPKLNNSCTTCPINNICVGGTYSFNKTTDQGIQSCASGTFAPTGSSVCYPHILHIGNDVVYVRSTKLTTPSLNIQIGNDIFYVNMTTVRTKMNKDSEHYFHAQWENNDYYICDDTTCPQ